jgi:hypothetical protein
VTSSSWRSTASGSCATSSHDGKVTRVSVEIFYCPT